jgi:GT2 family glycosyltransferase
MDDPALGNILVSFVIATHNRREALLHTLTRLASCGLDPLQYETLVIDNASTDGTTDALAEHHPGVRLTRLPFNRGSCAKNLALPTARGKYIVFLDDDSFPLPGSVPRMIRYFEADPRLGTAVFTVTLPDGSRECSAYPDVFIGCGTGFRRRALHEVAGLPENFFMQAEEYDLSLRLMQAGWTIRSFDTLHVSHQKTPTARRSNRVMRLDVRNNFVVASRYFPSPWRRTMRADWMRRYRAIASAKGQSAAYWLGLFQGFIRTMFARRRTVSAEVFEQFAKPRDILARMRRAQQAHNIRRALFIDYGKNMLPYWLGER